MSTTVRNVGIMLVVAVLGFVGIYLLHKRAQKYEPVWLEGDKAVEWPRERLPLKVWLDPQLDSYRKSFDEALTALNRDSGCKLVVAERNRSNATVLVLSEGTEQPSEVAGAWIRNKSSGPMVMTGEIRYAKPGDLTEVYLGMYHELGHVLGLAHDGPVGVPEYESGFKGPGFVSIMTNNVTEHSVRLDHGEFLPRLSEKDAAALKGRYCK